MFDLFVVLLSLACFAASQQLPGEAIPDYDSGNFTYPNTKTLSFTTGQTIDITWTSEMNNTNIFLITGYDWVHSTAIATNIVDKHFQWNVNLLQSLTPSNTTQVYCLRAVDSNGSTKDQTEGGFRSAAFYINRAAGDTAGISSTTTSTTSTSSAAAPTSAATTSAATQSSSTPQPSASSQPSSSGLSAGAAAGIGVGAAAAVIGLVLLAAFLFLRKRRQQRSQVQQPQSTAGGYTLHPAEEPKQHFSPQTYVEAPSSNPYPAHELPTGEHELPAGGSAYR